MRKKAHLLILESEEKEQVQTQYFIMFYHTLYSDTLNKPETTI